MITTVLVILVLMVLGALPPHGRMVVARVQAARLAWSSSPSLSLP